eukprot:scaffold699_cov385-Prasinococcus_capsulatus_cf.AAC.21
MEKCARAPAPLVVLGEAAPRGRELLLRPSQTRGGRVATLAGGAHWSAVKSLVLVQVQIGPGCALRGAFSSDSAFAGWEKTTRHERRRDYSGVYRVRATGGWRPWPSNGYLLVLPGMLQLWSYIAGRIRDTQQIH